MYLPTLNKYLLLVKNYSFLSLDGIQSICATSLKQYRPDRPLFGLDSG